MTPKHISLFLLAAAALVAPCVRALESPSEITVGLRLDSLDFVAGERVRGVVDIKNLSTDEVIVGPKGARDRFFIEVMRSNDRSELEIVVDKPFVAAFYLKSNEALKLETYLGDHYGLRTAGRYLARPVLVHDGIRYEGQVRAFDIVPGMRIGGALQMFAKRDELRRDFELLTWSRGGHEHLFVRAHDTGPQNHWWHTVDLGQLMKVTRPSISIMPTGEVVILHRVDPDNFIRSEFWSVPDDVQFHRREIVQDPETAGSNRVRELYKESGGVKPVDRPWWKFW